MLKIAIAGNVASGKSTIEKYLRENGYPVFDADTIAHKILESSEDVKTVFKNYDILTDGKIDRNKLAKIVFSAPGEMKKLESIIHPLVKNDILKIFKSDFDIVFIAVPQLFEAGFEKLFDKIIFVTAKEEIRLERLMKRNKLTREDALKRINSQIPDKLKIEKSDIVVENNGTIEELNSLIEKVLPI